MKKYLKDNMKSLLWSLILIVSSIIIYIIFNNKNGDGMITNELPNFNKKYSVNEVIPVFVTEEDLAKKYYADYIFLLNADIKRAYDLLSIQTKNKYKTIDEFQKFINSKKTNGSMKGSVKKYIYETVDNHKQMNIIDNNGNNWIFIEASIMDYTVEIN